MLNLGFAEFLFALILLIAAYFISHTINGTLQAWIIDQLGDSIAKDEGFMSLNPLKHFDGFGFLVLIILGVGWLQTVPIDPYTFTGPFRYVRLLCAFLSEAFISLLLATIFLFVAVYSFGYPLTTIIKSKLFMYYTHYFDFLLSPSPYLNIASLFTEQHSAAVIVFAFLLLALVYINIMIAMISSIFNGFRYFLVVGFEQGYTYIEYADYLTILGPILVVFVFGNYLAQYLLALTEWGACHIACLLLQ